MKVCEICGKGRTTGNNVSHSMRHTKRTFDANIQKVDVEIKDPDNPALLKEAKLIKFYL